MGVVVLSSSSFPCTHPVALLSCSCSMTALANPVSSSCSLLVHLLSSSCCLAVVLWPRWPTLCPPISVALLSCSFCFQRQGLTPLLGVLLLTPGGHACEPSRYGYPKRRKSSTEISAAPSYHSCSPVAWNCAFDLTWQEWNCTTRLRLGLAIRGFARHRNYHLGNCDAAVLHA